MYTFHSCVAPKGQQSGLIYLAGMYIQKYLKTRGSAICHECCTGDLCNQNLCAFEAGKNLKSDF